MIMETQTVNDRELCVEEVHPGSDRTSSSAGAWIQVPRHDIIDFFSLRGLSVAFPNTVLKPLK